MITRKLRTRSAFESYRFGSLTLCITSKDAVNTSIDCWISRAQNSHAAAFKAKIRIATSVSTNCDHRTNSPHPEDSSFGWRRTVNCHDYYSFQNWHFVHSRVVVEAGH